VNARRAPRTPPTNSRLEQPLHRLLPRSCDPLNPTLRWVSRQSPG
jgi:hypothetical protein